jgi:hypothetical protein
MNYDKLIGKSYLHRTSEVIIRDMYDKDGYLEVITNKGKTRIEKSEFKEEFLPIEDDSPNATPLALAKHFGSDADMRGMQSLADVLMSNINKVNTDPAFIDQARAINESAKTLIELQRAKIELIQTLRG